MTTRTTLTPGVLEAGGILDQIVDAKVRRLEVAKRRMPLDKIPRPELRNRVSFSSALSRNGVNVIAEIKHRSPSKGVIRADFDPVRIATSYESGGATALSILAEEDFFGGSIEHLKAVRDHVELPLLRKDFIFDEYQLHESASAGADAVLLIVALLDDELLSNLLQLAGELGLDALVEVHSSSELERAVRAGAKIIGVNNRDLKTFTVDLETGVRLGRLAPADAILVSESGINTGSDIRRLRSAGFSAFLVGEHLMRATEPGEALSQLINNASES